MGVLISFTAMIMVILVFMPCCVISSEAVTKTPLGIGGPKVTVKILNWLPDREELKIHCWSSDDDLGKHSLLEGAMFQFRFRVNFFSTTKFKCTASWRGVSMTFLIYKAKRDSDFRCPTCCLWIANATAVYGFRQHETNVVDIKFPWPTHSLYDVQVKE